MCEMLLMGLEGKTGILANGFGNVEVIADIYKNMFSGMVRKND